MSFTDLSQKTRQVEMRVHVLDFIGRGAGRGGRCAWDSHTVRNYPAPQPSVPFLVLLCPVLAVNRQGLEKAMITSGSNP